MQEDLLVRSGYPQERLGKSGNSSCASRFRKDFVHLRRKQKPQPRTAARALTSNKESVPVVLTCLCDLARLDDLAGGKAGGADANLLPGAVLSDDPRRLEVRKPPALGPVVRVADVVPRAGSFPADGADSGHGLLSVRGEMS